MLLALGMAASPALASGQQVQRPRFETTVEIVQMQVAVSDSLGYPITGLGRDDFRLRIEGAPRDLVAVYEVDLRRDDPEMDDDDSFVPPAGWRQWLLFFDFSFNSPWGIIRARNAAMEFVEKMAHPRDLIGVATYSTIQGIHLLSPFTSDHGQVLKVLGTMGLQNAPLRTDAAGFVLNAVYDELTAYEFELYGQQDPESFTVGGDSAASRGETIRDEVLVAELAEKVLDSGKSDFRRYRDEVTRYVGQIGDLGDLLTATRGRKQVVLFSQGFDDKVLTGQTLDELEEDNANVLSGAAWRVNSETRFGDSDMKAELLNSLEEMLGADAVIHALDTSGLPGDPSQSTFMSKGTGLEALNYLSKETSGQLYWNRNDLAPALADLEQQTAQFYVLAYRKDAGDPATVEVEVEIARPGARVVSAPKRLAPPPPYEEMNEAQRQLQLAEFVTKGIDEEDLIFDVRAVPYRGMRQVSRVAVVIEMPYGQLRELAAARGDGQVDLDLMAYVLDGEDRMRDVFGSTVHLDVERLGARGEVPFRYYNLLWAIPGEHKVRVLVREREIGRLSTRTEGLDVPQFMSPDLLVTDPVAIDAQRPGLIMRGMDPAAPPEHKAGGPVAYPFVVGDQELTPQVYTLTNPGGSCYFMLSVQGLARHPFTGEEQTVLRAVAFDELGNGHAIDEIAVVMRQDDPEGGSSFVIEARVPASLSPGAYMMQIEFTDGVAGTTVEKDLPFLVNPGQVTAR